MVNPAFIQILIVVVITMWNRLARLRQAKAERLEGRANKP